MMELKVHIDTMAIENFQTFDVEINDFKNTYFKLLFFY
jgi:hypothetical protein